MERADQFFKAVALGAMKPGEGRVIQAGLKKVALFFVDDEYLAVQNFCPHAGGFLGLGEVSNGCVSCPRHNWRFELRSGKCITNARYDIRRYETKIEDGWVYVGVPDDGGLL